MKKIFLLSLTVMAAFCGLQAQPDLAVEGVDFSDPKFQTIKHVGVPIDSFNIINGILEKRYKNLHANRFFKYQPGVQYRGVPDETVLAQILLIHPSRNRGRSVPFVVIIGNPNKAVGELRVVLNPGAYVDIPMFTKLYEQEVAKNSEKYARDYAGLQKAEESAKRHRESIVSPDFSDPSFESHTVQGDIKEIRSSILKILDGLKIDYQIEDVSDGSKYAEPDEEGMVGFFIVKRSNGQIWGKEYHPVFLVKGLNKAGIFLLVFSPNAASLASNVTVSLDQMLGLKPLDAATVRYDMNEIKRISRKGIDESPDHLDFTEEDFPFFEYSGRIDIIYKSTLAVLEEFLNKNESRKFKPIVSAMPGARRDLSRKKDLIESVDGEDFYEGFRIIFYDELKYPKGISAFALFGNGMAETGSFDMVFNPDVQIDEKRFAAVFERLYESLVRHEKKMNASELEIDADFKQNNKGSKVVKGSLFDIERAIKAAYAKLGGGAIGVRRFNEIPKDQNSAASKNVPRIYFITGDGKEASFAFVLVRGAPFKPAGEFEVVLSSEIGIDAEEFFSEMEKSMPDPRRAAEMQKELKKMQEKELKKMEEHRQRRR